MPPSAVPEDGAQGLLVPGRGATVSRAEALRRLPEGRAAGPEVTIYVSLPVGERHNVERYPVAIVGGGYDGLLVDSNTRLPGLVAIDSIRQTVDALAEGRDPPLEGRPDDSPRATLASLDEELREAHDARTRANLVLAVLVAGLSLLALGARSAYAARAAVLAVPVTLGLGLVARSALLLLAGGLLLALALAGPRRAFRPLLACALAGALLVLTQWPETNALATIGPHPDGGGRFYGLTNQTSTLLLPVALLAGLRAAPLALVAVGWSEAGADGGGLLVFAAGYAMLGLRAYGRLTPRRVAVAAAAVVALGVAIVAVDAATGGASHVTAALDRGLPGDVADRWRESVEGATRTWQSLALFALGAAALVRFALIRPRPAVLDALLVALAVSFVVNDTPQDVAFWGALGALTVLAHERAP